jgi:hypothetical protein
MAPSPVAGRRTATGVSPLKSGLLDGARVDCSPVSAPGLHGWWLRCCGSSAIALASFLLLPMAAAAVPLAPLIPATPVAAAPAGAPSGMNGPKRPGLIPHACLSRGGGARPMDCRKPRVGRFPGRTRPSLRTDNRQPVGAVVAHGGVLLKPRAAGRSSGLRQMAWASRLGIVFHQWVHSADPPRYNVDVMLGVLAWGRLVISLIGNLRLLTRHGA